MIAESGVRMYLLHQSREVGGSIDVSNRVVEGGEGIRDRARALDRRYLGHRSVGSRQVVVHDLFKASYVRLGRPDSWLDGCFGTVLRGHKGCGHEQGGCDNDVKFKHREPREIEVASFLGDSAV